MKTCETCQFYIEYNKWNGECYGYPPVRVEKKYDGTKRGVGGGDDFGIYTTVNYKTPEVEPARAACSLHVKKEESK